jgi:thymidylate kinase
MERQKARGQEKDYFESEKAEFYENLMDGYRELADFFPERILKLNAEKNQKEVTAMILTDLEKLLP